MQEYLDKIDLSTYSPTPISAIEREIDHAKFKEKGTIINYTTLGVVSMFIIIFAIIIGCLVWQRRRLQGLISTSVRRVRGEPSAPPSEDHRLEGLLSRVGQDEVTVRHHQGRVTLQFPTARLGILKNRLNEMTDV